MPGLAPSKGILKTWIKPRHDSTYHNACSEHSSKLEYNVYMYVCIDKACLNIHLVMYAFMYVITIL